MYTYVVLALYLAECFECHVHVRNIGNVILITAKSTVSGVGAQLPVAEMYTTP